MRFATAWKANYFTKILRYLSHFVGIDFMCSTSVSAKQSSQDLLWAEEIALLEMPFEWLTSFLAALKVTGEKQVHQPLEFFQICYFFC